MVQALNLHLAGTPLTPAFDLLAHNGRQQTLFPDKKIFFIGFNKCGTSTLHAFMRANGITSWHWHDKDGQSIAREVRKRSGTAGLKEYLANGTAFSDIGYIREEDCFEGNSYFREFHALFPDAYFILNDRNVENWIRSRCRHTGAKTGSMLARAMAFYKADEESTKAIWRAQHEAHVAAVLAHFAGSDTFLHFDIERDAPERLISFLSPFVSLDLTKWAIKNQTTAAKPPAGASPTVPAPTTVRARRFLCNPLLTTESPGAGDNVNGPSVIRVPDWVRNPLGRYYMYFAHHRGDFIRLAYADELTGPWRIYVPGTLRLGQCSAFRDHIASPDVHIDYDRREFRMYFHGPRHDRAGQWTGYATSADGLTFTPRGEALGKCYFRVWAYGGQYYALAKSGKTGWGELYQSPDGISNFICRGNFLKNMRHCAVLVRGNDLVIFYSRVGDVPERILASVVDMRADWMTWSPSEPIEVLRPVYAYEGARHALTPSDHGPATGVCQLRDPCVLDDDGKLTLFYTVSGEAGIAGAALDPIAIGSRRRS
jgi:hypothetical protein